MIWENWQIWTAIGMLLLVLEVVVPGFVLACLGIGCFGGAVAGFFELGIALELTIAGVIGLLSFLFLRPVALRIGFKGSERVSGVEALIGKECIVTETFDTSTGLGRCKIDGDDWRAKITESNNQDRLIEGHIAIIERVESNTLIVYPKSISQTS
ncbi:MAG: NfeD family protein [Bacteroidetes bacterium]|nr:NfeD family protein [Bacteroidota bacterium]MDA1335901.1 NfeD family protein [Bacteroidota bacterium]